MASSDETDGVQHRLARLGPLVAGVAVVAFLARLIPVVRGAGLSSVLYYDDGVYYTAADAFVHGRSPYADFVLLHPPGVVLAVAPFAALGRVTSDVVGLETARIAFMLVGALTAVLVALVALRLGRPAAWAAGMFYAVWWPAAHSENTTLLEPLVNLGLAGSLLVLGDPRRARRGRLVAAGGLVGAACGVKLWAVVPLVVLLVWVAVRSRAAAAAGWFVLGAAGVFTAICLPFLLLAPTAMPRMVVLDQLNRARTGVGPGARLADVLAIRQVSSTPAPSSVVAVAVLLTLGVLVAAVAIAVKVPMTRPWAALLVANVVALLAVAAFFPKYADFAAVPLALMAGAGAHVVVSWARAQSIELGVAAFWTVTAAIVVLGLVSVSAGEGRAGHGRWLASQVSRDRCVVADDPIALVQANVLSRSLSRGCEVVPDTTGTSYDLARRHVVGSGATSHRRSNAAWQAWMADYLLDPNVFILSRPSGTGYSGATLRCLRDQALVARLNGFSVYQAPGGQTGETNAVEQAEMGRGTAIVPPRAAQCLLAHG